MLKLAVTNMIFGSGLRAYSEPIGAVLPGTRPGSFATNDAYAYNSRGHGSGGPGSEIYMDAGLPIIAKSRRIGVKEGLGPDGFPATYALRQFGRCPS